MKKEDKVQKVKDLLAAPTCCAAVKAAAQAYLDAAGTEGEAAAGKALIAALEANVNTIDDTIAFAENDARRILGEEAAKGLAEQGHKVKAAGGKYCFCPACTVGVEILAARDMF